MRFAASAITLLLLFAPLGCEGVALKSAKSFAFADGTSVALIEGGEGDEASRRVQVTLVVSGFQTVEVDGGVKVSLVGGLELLDPEGRPAATPLPPEVQRQVIEQRLDAAPRSATITLTFPAPPPLPGASDSEAAAYVLLLKATDALSGAEIRQRQKLEIPGSRT